MEEKVQLAIEKGAAFLKRYGRAVEQALFAYFYEDGSRQSVLDALAAYQNGDGGFGHAFEPDMRSPDSSALATTEALAWIWQIQVEASHPMVEAAVKYLVNTYIAEEKSWLFIPESSQNYPHAPWWQFNPSAAATKHNPRPQILGIFLRAEEQVPVELLQTLQQDVVTAFLEHINKMQMHDVFNYLRLYRTPNLPEEIRQPLAQYLPEIVERAVAMDEDAWSGYALRPYGVLDHLDDEFYPLVAEALPASLMYLVHEQCEDGSWPLTWNWGEKFPTVWPIAEKEWKSIVTLDNIRFLQSLGAVVSS
ncbi:MAG: hypothetical protein V2J07_07270 [Anaerolineae bacterium]|jgi:hypothetical protein|nr:hypothetical protein [Anaerolineae bacterium]